MCNVWDQALTVAAKSCRKDPMTDPGGGQPAPGSSRHPDAHHIEAHRGERRRARRRRSRTRRLIEGAVAQVFGVAADDLDLPTRGRARVAFARQVAMYVTHVSCGLSMTDVGALFMRDRTTVAYACMVVEDRRDDPIFDRVIELLEWIVPTLIASRFLSRTAYLAA
jgi:hypothetical protein